MTYLTPTRTRRDSQTVMAMARMRAANAPKEVKTDGLRSYQEAVPRAFVLDMTKQSSARVSERKSTTTFLRDFEGRFETETRLCAA